MRHQPRLQRIRPSSGRPCVDLGHFVQVTCSRLSSNLLMSDNPHRLVDSLFGNINATRYGSFDAPTLDSEFTNVTTYQQSRVPLDTGYLMVDMVANTPIFSSVYSTLSSGTSSTSASAAASTGTGSVVNGNTSGSRERHTIRLPLNTLSLPSSIYHNPLSFVLLQTKSPRSRLLPQCYDHWCHRLGHAECGDEIRAATYKPSYI
ncbi:hypothetical protein LXA43DRAFT_599991 [Ganoderma leucocontextum]|nr:hypothetical protein LXA43DRAFT_599991 [Ganoderma leucocontextum]